MAKKRQKKNGEGPKNPKKSHRAKRRQRVAASANTTGLLAGTAVVFLIAIAIGLIEKLNSGLYLRIVQEDDILEWATVWAFLGAMLFFALVARQQWRTERRLPWFTVGLSLFCFLFAMEEISWGQRILGYRPPAYFLEHNFQQEFNFHNVVSTSLRKSTLLAILLGYGIALPLAGLGQQLRRGLERLGLVIPPLAAVATFGLSLALYSAYPWDFTGEVTELLMGIGFLLTALFHYREGKEAAVQVGWRRFLGPFVLAVVVTMALGFANSAISQAQRGANPDLVQAAASEIEALKRDFLELARLNGGKPVTRCGLHKRVYSYVEKYDRDELYSGTFASLQAQGLPEDRAQFFLDPWNSPYWIRHRCSKKDGLVRVFVYSFGPNRQRNSSRWEVLGDDVGGMIFEQGTLP